MSKKYKLDRKKFIEYYPVVIHGMIDYDQVKKDLIKGSQFLVTAQDILDSMDFIAGKLVGEPLNVRASDCELVYTE